jgi:hypothetical protein
VYLKEKTSELNQQIVKLKCKTKETRKIINLICQSFVKEFVEFWIKDKIEQRNYLMLA